MKELMIHVERIVRPVRAMQSRKLRMRRELLAHLQAALDEERAGGADDASAIEAAKRRLGDPAELTRSLQQSVPWLERTLMMRVPGVSVVDHLEKYSEPVWGLDRGVTMLHSGIVVLGGTALAYLALMFAVLVLPPRQILRAMVDRTSAAVVMNLVNVVAFYLLMMACSGYMFALSRQRRPRWHRLRIALIVALPTVVMGVTVAATAQRAPMTIELLRSFSIGVALLLTTLSLAQIVARLRRPYDPWLTLDIAE